jgi:hypothetical protein
MRWLLPLLVAVAACSGCKSKKKAPADAAPPPIDAPKKDISSGAGPGPRQTAQLGEPFSADADGAAGEPGLAVDGAGHPLLAWVEKGKVQVRQWNGSAWDPIGTPPNDATHRASGKPSLVFEPAGTIVVAWQEMNKQDINVLQLARWKDNAWTMLPELGSGKAGVMDPIVESSPFGLVAVWRESVDGKRDAVHGSKLDEAKGWQPLVEGGLLRVVEEGTTRHAPALSVSKAGALVGWIEVSPAPTLQLRRFDATGVASEVPSPQSVDNEGVDDESTLAVALSPDGTVTVSLSFSAGLRQIVQLAPGATEWKKIDVAEVANGYAIGQRLLSVDDGRVAVTYPYGGRFAWWDGSQWFATPVGVMAPSPVVPVIAAASGTGGSVFVAWSAGPANAPAKVRVVEVKSKALGEK